jgi:REP element-mobilizing transposase RayT
MIRGNNQAQLFYDDEDRAAFLERLVRYKQECPFSLHAYCLMGNHVHLVVQVQDIPLPTIIKRLALSYSYWFNKKYDRNGYLFQGRYKSEPVTSDEYFLAVVRYIHNNPVKVGLPISSWTSYNDYVKPSPSSLTDTDLLLAMLDTDEGAAKEAFEQFMATLPDEEFSYLDADKTRMVSDAEAISMILQVSGLASCNDVSFVEKDERKRILVALKAKGLSIRQIARLTGINRGIVAKAKD